MNLGRAAYDGYRVASDGRSKVSGAPLPEWEDQAPEIRECWRAAADCVVMALELAASVDREVHTPRAESKPDLS